MGDGRVNNQICPGLHLTGHFRVHVCLLFKASLSAKFLSQKSVLACDMWENPKTDFAFFWRNPKTDHESKVSTLEEDTSD